MSLSSRTKSGVRLRRSSRPPWARPRISAPESSATRFVFGFATGLKVFPKPHWGFRLQIEYLPIVMEANLQRLVCINGGCIVALNGSVLNQLQLSAGPAFRF